MLVLFPSLYVPVSPSPALNPSTIFLSWKRIQPPVSGFLYGTTRAHLSRDSRGLGRLPLTWPISKGFFLQLKYKNSTKTIVENFCNSYQSNKDSLTVFVLYNYRKIILFFWLHCTELNTYPKNNHQVTYAVKTDTSVCVSIEQIICLRKRSGKKWQHTLFFLFRKYFYY